MTFLSPSQTFNLVVHANVDKLSDDVKLFIKKILAIANISFITILYKELKIGTFDASLAVSVGLMPVLIHYLLMIMVATTAVVAFESVGAILVIAFFIVPAAGAYLLTDRLYRMIISSWLISQMTFNLTTGKGHLNFA